MGLRRIEFAFKAFIHSRYGVWIPEPLPLGLIYDFKGDNRGFGRAGTSRLFSTGSIESAEIGSVNAAQVVTDTGFSHRGRLTSEGTWIRWSKKATPFQRVQISNTKDFRTDPPTCNTVVDIQAAAAYPFFFLSPDINYHVRFAFEVVGKGCVKVSVNGTHDAFPDYEALVDGRLIYTNASKWGGPGTGLTIGHLLGFNIIFGPASTNINASTPNDCSQTCVKCP